jgi:4-hydroxybenzoate polyprenyltransferase
MLFAGIYVIMACMSIAYSHPRFRWKGRPLPALATVAIGQGVLGSLGGWVCARGELVSALSAPGLLSIFAATCLTVGFYPLTGIYQIEEDRARGDQTLPVWLGAPRAFRFSLVSLFLGGVAAIVLILPRFGLVEAAVLGLFLLLILALVWRWAKDFNATDIHGNFRTLMRLYATMSLGFIGWIGLHLLGLR